VAPAAPLDWPYGLWLSALTPGKGTPFQACLKEPGSPALDPIESPRFQTIVSKNSDHAQRDRSTPFCMIVQIDMFSWK
jgi:hypothetical protein